MKLMLIRTHHGLAPVDDEGVEAIKQIKQGDVIIVTYKKHRNVGNHRRLFSFLTMIVQNSDKYDDVENLLDVLKLKAGYFKTVVTHDGKPLYVPKSISFESMGEDEFKAFFSKCIDVCLEFMPEETVNSIMSYA